MRELMPIMGSVLMDNVPMAVLEPHARQAESNHGQTLERLAQRGGLAPSEAIDIILGRRWGTAVPTLDNERWLIEYVRRWRAQNARS